MKTMENRLVIGITGGIAGGKSSIRHILENYGFWGIDADSIAHEVIGAGGSAVEAVARHFGPELYTEDTRTLPLEKRAIDRKRLAEIVFSDRSTLAALEQITYPAITQKISTMILNAEGPVVVEAIKLFQSGINQLCDEIWLVYASREVRINRLIKYRKMSEKDARARTLIQEKNDWDNQRLDRTICTDGSLAEVRDQVVAILADLEE